MSTLLTRKQLADKAGVPITSINHWAKEGILKPKEITHGGYRLYDEDESVKIIKKVLDIKKQKSKKIKDLI